MYGVANRAFLSSGEHTIYQSDCPSTELLSCVVPGSEPATVQVGAKYSSWPDSSICAGRLQALRAILAVTGFTA